MSNNVITSLLFCQSMDPLRLASADLTAYYCSYLFELCWTELQVVLKEPILNCPFTFLNFLDIESTFSADPQCVVDLCFFFVKLVMLQTSIPNNIFDR